MRLREEIHNAVNRMPIEGLALLHEQVRILESMKSDLRQKRKSEYAIEKVLEITRSSSSCWADAVISDREDRI